MLNIYITQKVFIANAYQIMCNILQTKFMCPFCLVWKGYRLDERQRCQLQHPHNFLDKDCVFYSTCVATSETQPYVANYYQNVVSKCCEYIIMTWKFVLWNQGGVNQGCTNICAKNY